MKSFAPMFYTFAPLISCTLATSSFGADIGRFEVYGLPNVNFSIPHSWAGELPIPGHGNDNLFFWLFEGECSANKDDLIIWLNGGPGCSSLEGLTQEIGPLCFQGNAMIPAPNPYSWTKLANVLFVDQPVGVGFSTGNDTTDDNAEVTSDFYLWLKEFFQIFNGLASKNVYLMGESYAGIYIPYFAADILKNKDQFPLNLKSISIGDGTIGNDAAQTDVSITKFMRKHNDILQIPQDILETFEQANRQCGFANVMSQIQYPPNGSIQIPGDPEGENFKLRKRQDTNSCNLNPGTPSLIAQEINGSCYGGCATWSTADDYLSLTKPWSVSLKLLPLFSTVLYCLSHFFRHKRSKARHASKITNYFSFNVYNIAYDCSTNPNDVPYEAYLNLPSVKAALHATSNTTFVDCNAAILDLLTQELVTPPTYSILPSILEQGIYVHTYSGDYDFLLNHFGAELVIQNMTWNGAQGLQSPPTKTFQDANGNIAGNWGYDVRILPLSPGQEVERVIDNMGSSTARFVLPSHP
ncbi:MAG: hypothetical protein M1827_002897 [Pycnora praestabilis]|nr:MAG: hypothetical protein M1827_002897 [Pycnora praestabilis]